MVFVTSDPHGHRREFLAALQSAGLVDTDENWAGGEQALHVLGDLMDRGPDGVGVIDLVMSLQRQAEAAGGRVGVVLGNHEVLALAMHRFRELSLTGDHRAVGLALTWHRNGGRLKDQEALTDDHVEWLAELPAMIVVDGHLMMHSDTAEYLHYGDDVASINAAVTEVLLGDDLDAWWDCLHRTTDRHAFATLGGLELAEKMMATLGVRRMVHGHSIVGDLRGIEAAEVDSALLYARRQVLAIDGGIYAGGPCLVVDLDDWPG
jgi:hypothetical protein